MIVQPAFPLAGSCSSQFLNTGAASQFREKEDI